jgi:hypothetical protein
LTFGTNQRDGGKGGQGTGNQDTDGFHVGLEVRWSTSRITHQKFHPPHFFLFLDASIGSLPINWPRKPQNDTKMRVPIRLTAKAREVARRTMQ